MACPRCGGSEREPISPAYWRCTSSSTSASMQVGPVPGAPPWAGIVGPQLTTRFVVCGHEYHEAVPLSGEPSGTCECGTFAIGRCAECSRPVCGSHSKLVDGRRLCEVDVAEHAAKALDAERLDGLRNLRVDEEAMRARLITYLESLPSEMHRAVARATANDTLGYGYGVGIEGRYHHGTSNYNCVVDHVRGRTWYADLPGRERLEAASSWEEFAARADHLCGGPFGSMTTPWRNAQHLTDWFFEQLPEEPVTRYKFQYSRHDKDARWPKLPKRSPGYVIGSKSDDRGTQKTWLTTDARVLVGGFDWHSKDAYIRFEPRGLTASDVGLIGKTLKLAPASR